MCPSSHRPTPAANTRTFETPARPPVAIQPPCGSPSPRVACCGADAAEIARRAEAIRRKEATLRAKEVCGTPAEVIDRLGEWADAGADTAYLQILDLSDLDHLRLIGREVLPALRD